MGDAGSFVRVMRCTADIKPVLPSWGSRCCVCASNFPSNLFLPSSLGGTCTYRRCWWREKRCPDGGRENGAAAAANKRIRRWRSSGRLLLESSSGGFRLSSPIHSFTPHAFCTLLQGITRYTSALNCFFSPLHNFLLHFGKWPRTLRGVVTLRNGAVGSAPFKKEQVELI